MSEWIEWKGGTAPVAPEEFVSVKLRDGDFLEGEIAEDFCGYPGECAAKCESGCCNWHHDGGGLDIIAYRILSPLPSRGEG